MVISSKNQTVLVFSDPHQDISRVDAILGRENYDVAVCLGDWMDSRIYEEESDFADTLDFLEFWLFSGKLFTCIGNHDIQYLYGNPTTFCSGFRAWKNKFINDSWKGKLPEIRGMFNWYLWVDDFLCSHAGLNPYHLPPMQDLSPDALSKWLNSQISQADVSLANNGEHWLYAAGKGRGGKRHVGGLIWQDFRSEFEPIAGLKQMVGHTRHPHAMNHHLDGSLSIAESDNIVVDCGLTEYLLILNGKIQVKKYSDL